MNLRFRRNPIAAVIKIGRAQPKLFLSLKLILWLILWLWLWLCLWL